MARKKKIDLGFTPSPYQEKVFDFVEHGVGNAVISALAGSGKTTTIVACMRLVPKTQKCLFLAFNKSIVEALSEKVRDNSNCYVKTMHSLGYLMVRRNLGNDIGIDEYKYNSYVRKNIAELTTVDGEKMTRQQLNEYIDNILQLINFSRLNLAQSEKEIIEIAAKYSIPVLYDEPLVVQKCLKWGSENYDMIDYTDMVWLPYELSLKPSGLQYDWIFGDECQDFSKAYIELFLKCLKRGGRFISVGDEKQMINAFAGSSIEAFKFMCNYPNTKVFELPITYRCPISVVEMAKNYVPSIQPRENAPQGQILQECKTSILKDGDMVLARSKTPLIKLYTKLLKRGVKCFIKGQDIGLNLIKMIDDIECDKLNTNLEADGVFVRLYDALFEERNKIMLKYGISKDDATLSSQIMEKYDSINSLITLAGKMTEKASLIEKIKNVFKEDKNGIMLSTVHKAKGLEADNVYILCWSCMPSKLAHQDWEKQQEENLMYVAITRPKQTLGFISEKEIPPSGNLQEPIEVLNELKFIEKQVCKILGKEIVDDSNDVQLSRINIKNAKDMSDVTKQKEKNQVNISRDKRNGDDSSDVGISMELMESLMKYLSDDKSKTELIKFLNK